MVDVNHLMKNENELVPPTYQYMPMYDNKERELNLKLLTRLLMIY